MNKLKAIIKGSLKSKTMWFSGIIMALGAVSDNSQYLRELLEPQVFNMVMIVIGVVVALLRLQTTKPLEDK
jgi:hypothetical protein